MPATATPQRTYPPGLLPGPGGCHNRFPRQSSIHPSIHPSVSSAAPRRRVNHQSIPVPMNPTDPVQHSRRSPRERERKKKGCRMRLRWEIRTGAAPLPPGRVSARTVLREGGTSWHFPSAKEEGCLGGLVPFLSISARPSMSAYAYALRGPSSSRPEPPSA